MNFKEINERDKAVVKALQGDFPLCEEPYKVLAEQVGMSEEEFIERVKILTSEKKIRKMGAVLRHREAGFVANALCAWLVPPERLDQVAKIMTENPAVSHCYDRTTAPNWNYNLYTMIHAKSREECDQIVKNLSELTAINDFQVLYSKKEWKKTSMKYFCEEL
ncbi:MAG: Lrp/AsnC family transcriptional regulator [Selenomonadaceae bacterium]|nr:Lrp/AsnC family transcriptional regulator [Selenomonadaceae bacterium]